MFQTQESIAGMLRHAIVRCATICRNLNSETYGEERGPDCARRIEKEAESIIQETLALHQQPPKMTYAEVVAWLASDEGKQSMAQALASANVTIEALRKDRQIDPAILHQPFGLEYENAQAVLIDAEVSIRSSTDAAFDKHIAEISSTKPKI